jgi:hypothetical protein
MHGSTKPAQPYTSIIIPLTVLSGLPENPGRISSFGKAGMAYQSKMRKLANNRLHLEFAEIIIRNRPQASPEINNNNNK